MGEWLSSLQFTRWGTSCPITLPRHLHTKATYLRKGKKKYIVKIKKTKVMFRVWKKVFARLPTVSWFGACLIYVLPKPICLLSIHKAPTVPQVHPRAKTFFRRPVLRWVSEENSWQLFYRNFCLTFFRPLVQPLPSRLDSSP